MMRDEQENVATESEAEEKPELRAGARLAAARREQQIALAKIAKELHLDEAKVQALENNDFETLGAPVFAKGHLRKYASLVAIDVKDVMADYYELTRAEGVLPVVAGRPKIRRELAPGPWIILVIFGVAIVTAYWWLGTRGSGPAETPTTELDVVLEAETRPTDTQDESGQDAAAAALEPEPEPLPESVPEPVAEPLAEPLPQVVEQPAPSLVADSAAGLMAPVTEDPNTRLTLDFYGDCWTEISDADGRRLFYAMGRSGQTVEIAGRAPISVLFGDGNNVSMKVDGSPYALPPLNPSSGTVRLTLSGQEQP